jgi:hypothetical protein
LLKGGDFLSGFIRQKIGGIIGWANAIRPRKNQLKRLIFCFILLSERGNYDAANKHKIIRE